MNAPTTKTVGIVLNGEPRQVPEGLCVRRLLEFLEIDPSRVAVELDREIVPKAQWDAVTVTHGASLEVVWFVGGGTGR